MAYERIEHAGGAVDTTLASDITSLDTSLSVADATAWPTGSDGPFYVLVDPGTSAEEKMLATALASTTLTGLTRGVDGTGAFDHSAGVVVKHVLSATEVDEANELVANTLGTIATKGDLPIGTGNQQIDVLAVAANDRVLTTNSALSTGAGWQQVNKNMIAAATFGDGLAGGDGDVVVPVVDGVTIDTTGAGNSLEVIAGGVGTTQLADGSVTAPKLAADSVAAANIVDGTITAAKMATQAWTSYSPTWGSTSAGGGSVSHTLGNGVVEGAYIQYGKTVHFRMSATVGSTTSLGASVIYTFTLPVAPKTGIYQCFSGSAIPGTAATSRQFQLSGRTNLAASTTIVAVALDDYDGKLLGPENPVTTADWVTSTAFTLTGVYEAD